MDTELNKEMRESFSLLVACAITLAALVGLSLLATAVLG